jgi:amino acid transporter
MNLAVPYKLATRKLCLRVVLLYALLVFIVGLNEQYTDFNLRDTSIAAIRKGHNAPIIIQMMYAGVASWPHLVNAFSIFSAFSLAVNALYIS